MPFEKYPVASPSVIKTPSFEVIGEVVRTMRQQESTAYKIQQYSAETLLSDLPVGLARQMVCKWMYSRGDDLEISSNIPAFAATYLDMILAKKSNIIKSLADLRLATVTSLNLALKINSSKSITLDILAQFAGNEFTKENIVQMEELILKELRWHLNPPTGRCFQLQFMKLFPQDVAPTTTFHICEMSRFLLERITTCHTFLKFKPSVIAYTTLLIAIEKTSEDDLSLGQRAQFFCRMKTIAMLKHDSEEVHRVYMHIQNTIKEVGDLRRLASTGGLWISRGQGSPPDIPGIFVLNAFDSPKDVYSVYYFR